MSIPRELINLFIGYSEDDLRTLFRLCLVSRACYYAARPLLYRNVQVVASRESRITALGKMLFDVISSDSQLASYVHDFTFDAAFYSQESEIPIPTLLTVLHKTLNSMCRLRKHRLVFPGQCDDEFPIDPALLGHNFQLEEFYWRDFRWYISIAPQLHKFLASQARIKTLELVSGPDTTFPTFPIAPTACPDLHTFSGNFQYFQELAPTRLITNFVWSGVSPVPSSVLESLAPSFSRLRLLVFHEGFPSELDLAILTSHLSSLEILHLSLEDTRTIFQAYRQIQSAQRFVDHIHKLTKLRAFVLRVQPPQFQFHEHSQRMLSCEWFNALPKLERTYFNGAVGNSEDLLCWTRGQILKPRRTVMKEVYEMYREEYGLEIELLRPFFSSQSFPGISENPSDDFGKLGGHGWKKHCFPNVVVGQRSWRWRILFWVIISLVSLLYLFFDGTFSSKFL